MARRQNKKAETWGDGENFERGGIPRRSGSKKAHPVRGNGRETYVDVKEKKPTIHHLRGASINHYKEDLNECRLFWETRSSASPNEEKGNKKKG